MRFGPVADAPVDATAIAVALRLALARGRHRGEPGVVGVPAGPAAPRIVEALRRWTIPRPPRKRFHQPG